METTSKIFIAGAGGLVGSSIVRALRAAGYRNLLVPTHHELDLTDAVAVGRYYAEHRPEYVFVAAAKVGGIHANSTFPADFIVENLRIETNVIASAHQARVRKLLFLGSSCIYPRDAKQPMNESELLAGRLEETNIAYATAKIAGIIMCQSFNRQYGTKFITAMPTNMYGPNDNYHPENSHVIPGLIRRVHEAKASSAMEVKIWGTGTPLREFLYSDDLAEACLFLMKNYADNEIINIGSGTEIPIRDLAEKIKRVVGYTGQLVFDPSKPDGTPRKLLDVGKINRLGWKARTDLDSGLKLAYDDFKRKHG